VSGDGPHNTGMGHRLSKIYTRTGDDGTTGLGDGSRVPKDDARVEAYGTVDELNSAVGLVLAAPALPESIRTCLTAVQHDLFDLGGELSIPGARTLCAEHVARLERTLDELNEALPPLKEFILPSGGATTAACHLARAVCRRAERRLWTLIRREAATQPINPESAKYLNRLSDLLFVIARVLVRHERGAEVLWRHDRGATPREPA
jgi:cob(I)alamin adenosyltransferase